MRIFIQSNLHEASSVLYFHTHLEKSVVESEVDISMSDNDNGGT